MVTADTALKHSTVWACINLIGSTISTLPLDVYQDGEQVDTPPVLEEPAAGYALHDFVGAVTESLLLHGNTIGLVTARSGASLLPVQVELVDFRRVSLSLDPEDGSVTVRIGGQEFDYLTDIWHIRGLPAAGAVLGRSPITNGAETIAHGLAAQRFASEFFGAGAGGVPLGILKPSPGATWDRGGDEHHDTAKSLVSQWREYRTRRTGVVVLDQVDYEQIEFDADAMQLNETLKTNVQAVCRLFGVPPEMVASEAAGSLTYSNVEMRNLDFLKFCLNPWLIRVEAGLSKLLPRNQRAKFNVDALLRPDTKTRFEAHAIALSNQFETVDEVRDLEDLPPLPTPPVNAAPEGQAAQAQDVAR
jgi:HK97 family phage portal protein